MPDRVIRDDILDSERYLGLTSDGVRLLFIHLLLVADDLGNVEVGPTFLRRRVLAAPVNDETISKMLNELGDADLVRLYQSGRKCYAHVPRYRQRLRYHTRNCNPMPPDALVGAEDLKRIKELTEKKTDFSLTEVGLETAKEKRSEEKRSEEERVSVAAQPSPPTKKPASKATALPNGEEWQVPDDWLAYACRVYGIDRQRAVRISLAFRDWHLKAPADKGLSKNWLASWRMWLRKEFHDA